MEGWGRRLGIRPGEARTVLAFAALFAAMEAGGGFGEIGVDTLVVSRFGAGIFPYLFIGLGTLSLVAALAYGAALGRLPRIQFLSGLLFGAAAALLLERLLMATQLPIMVPLAWLTVYGIGAIAVTIAWTMAGSVFDTRQAKRLFPLCTGAAIAGRFAGTLSSGPIASAVGTETLIVLQAAMLAIVGGLILWVSRITTVRVPPRRRDASIVAELRVGFDGVMRSPLMRLVALAYVLLAILMASVTYPFMQVASQTFTTESSLATALGLLSAAVTATSLVVTVLLANRVYARFGVAGAALLLPLVYLGGFGLWLVAFGFPTAALFRFTQQVTQRGVSNAAWSAFYNVIPTERRAQVLAFNDGVPAQVGAIIAGFLLLAGGRLLDIDQMFLLGIATALAATAVGVAIRRGYAASLVRALRAGFGEQVLEGGPGLAAITLDPAGIRALDQALAAPEPAVRATAAALLGRTSADRAGGLLIGVVDDEIEPSVRVAALDALTRLGGPPRAAAAAMASLGDVDDAVRAAAVRTLGAVSPDDLDEIAASRAIDELVVDRDPEVRASVACLLGSRGPEDRSSGIVQALLDGPDEADRVAGLGAVRRIGDPVPLDAVRACLADPSARVRQAAVRALAASTDRDATATGLIAALADGSSDVRTAAADALAAFPSVPAGLLDVLDDGSTRAQEATLLALQGHGPEVRVPLIAWTQARLERATDLRRARSALAPPTTAMADPPRPDPASPRACLIDTLAGRETAIIGMALGALVVLGTPEAGGVIRRSLRSSDPEVRAQAIETLDSVGDRGLTGALVRLLEDDQHEAQDDDAVLHRLADDGDPWIARLASQTLSTRAEMSRTSRTLGDLETMLLLRRVPLFEGLDPEDLQRIAMTAVEHVYPAGDVLVHEGDPSESLVVIVEGSVRVVHVEADGSERLIRRYGSGDHIGELAALREAPRAATVIAEGDGVRGLVIEGVALKAILRERPDAAMAMLATLAERISAQ
jgi:HEAT repeat protein